MQPVSGQLGGGVVDDHAGKCLRVDASGRCGFAGAGPFQDLLFFEQPTQAAVAALVAVTDVGTKGVLNGPRLVGKAPWNTVQPANVAVLDELGLVVVPDTL